MRTIKIQLGNPSDNAGARLVTGVVLGTLEPLTASASLITYVGVLIGGDPYVASSVGSEAPHHPLAEGYSTYAVPLDKSQLKPFMVPHADEIIRERFVEHATIKSAG